MIRCAIVGADTDRTGRSDRSRSAGSESLLAIEAGTNTPGTPARYQTMLRTRSDSADISPQRRHTTCWGHLSQVNTHLSGNRVCLKGWDPAEIVSCAVSALSRNSPPHSYSTFLNMDESPRTWLAGSLFSLWFPHGYYSDAVFRTEDSHLC